LNVLTDDIILDSAISFRYENSTSGCKSNEMKTPADETIVDYF